jgi:hypothetical protein
MRSRRLFGLIGAMAMSIALLPTVAYAGGGSTVSEGCKTTKHDALCINATGQKKASYVDGNVATYVSNEGQFVYKGIGPWVIRHAGGTIRCPRRVTCQQFFPPVFTSKATNVSITTRRNSGEVFVGFLQTGGD